MRLFNDLWTKEVFANFMAAKIVNPGFPGIDHELNFLVRHYPGAYGVDRSRGVVGSAVRHPGKSLRARRVADVEPARLLAVMPFPGDEVLVAQQIAAFEIQENHQLADLIGLDAIEAHGQARAAGVRLSVLT